jgi:L-lactate utilization protein LutB
MRKEEEINSEKEETKSLAESDAGQNRSSSSEKIVEEFDPVVFKNPQELERHNREIRKELIEKIEKMLKELQSNPK